MRSFGFRWQADGEVRVRVRRTPRAVKVSGQAQERATRPASQTSVDVKPEDVRYFAVVGEDVELPLTAIQEHVPGRHA
jgi:valyl-tRNA synthetase